MMKCAVTLAILFALCFAATDAASGAIECAACKFVVGKIQAYAKADQQLDNQTITLVENDVCSHLPDSYKALCDSAAEEFLPTAIHSLEDKYLDPEFACTSLKLCDAIIEMSEALHAEGDLECNLCTLATSWISQEIQTNTSEAFIEKEVENLCAQFPKYQSLCDSIVESSGPAVIAKVAEEIKDKACAAIHMCPQPAQVGAIKCDICEFVVGKVQTFVETDVAMFNKTEQVIEDNLCTRLPQSIQALCNSTVTQELPDIVKALADKFLDPQTDCTAAGLCSNSSAFMMGSNDLKCDICQAAAGWADQHFFETQSGDQFMINVLDKVCAVLPAEFVDVCDNAVQAATPAIMTKIGQFIATDACKDIKLCQ